MPKNKKHQYWHSRAGPRLAFLLVFMIMTSQSAPALASSWNPTLLANTEAFQTIDDSDSTANVVLQFGGTLAKTLTYDRTKARFQFSAGLSVLGTLTGSALNVDRNATVGGRLTVTGALLGVGNITARSAISGAALNVSRNATVGGTLTVTGAIVTNGNLTVRGTVSGALLRASNVTVSGAVIFSSGNLLRATAKGLSGQLLIARGTGTPEWKNPTGSLVWYLDSTIAAGTNQGAIYTLPFGITASTGSLRIKGAPTGANLIVDIRRDGTSIFSTKPTILAGNTIGGKQMVLSTTNLTEGSELSVSVDQVGSTFAGSGLTIMLTGTRKY